MAMSAMSLSGPEAVRLRWEPDEAVHSEDMRLWRLEIQRYDGREEFLERFKQAPAAPTTLRRSP